EREFRRGRTSVGTIIESIREERGDLRTHGEGLFRPRQKDRSAKGASESQSAVRQEVIAACWQTMRFESRNTRSHFTVTRCFVERTITPLALILSKGESFDHYPMDLERPRRPGERSTTLVWPGRPTLPWCNIGRAVT